MSELTLDEAIKHCLEVAEENDLAAGTYEILAENNHNAYERLTAETNSSRCAECAADHRQLAEWLTELKEAKRLLRSTIDEWHIVCEWGDCSERCDWFENGKCTQEWSGKAEALKLIGDGENDT